MSVDMVEVSEPPRTAGIPQQNRVFLDFFWDLAKPDQEVRLKAVQSLIQYLSSENKLDYTFKRLVDGLAHTRETARPGFSLALGQVLSAFEDVSLQSVLDRIKEKHNLQFVKKKLARNAMFGNLFGVLALHQSGRLSKPPVLLGCVQLLQNLSQHKQHLKDLPSKTMMDILTEVSDVFEEVLMGALQSDLSSAFRTPEQLQLLLVALQHFPQALKPKKLKTLLGSSTIINAENIPKLTELMKMTARSVKKERVLPAVVLDLLKLSLKEGSFELFWNKAITEGMFREHTGPTHYLSFRLLGSALPLLSVDQLKKVLSGEVMMHYGEHVVSAQKPDRFKLAPEMDAYVSDFLQGCQDPDKQLAVMLGFSSLTNHGYPVVPSAWRVVQHLQPAALQAYVEWLRNSFLHPQMDQLLDFSTRKQKSNQEAQEEKEDSVCRLRKWIMSRLCSIIDNQHVKKQEDMIMEVARFVFFHAFFTVKKASPDIAESKEKLSVPLDERTRSVLVNLFFGLLMSLHHLPLTDDSTEGAVGQKRVFGVTADGTMWIYHLVQYAALLLNQPKHVQRTKPFSPEQTEAWEGMLESVANLKKKAKKGPTEENRAFQQLFLLVGMHLFKAPEELLDIIKDLQSCVDRAQEKKAKKKSKKQATAEEEPEWVEVMVDILLSLLSQQSRHIRQVCKTVFSSIVPHLTHAALTAILDEDESDDSADDSDADDEDMKEEEEEDETMEGEEVDQNFRLELMKVLQQKKALEGSSSDDDMDDEAMMQLDKGLSALFSEQKKKNQAKKDEKAKMQKEKALVRDYKIKVLDMVEVIVSRQAGSPLVLSLVEPLLSIIERGMNSTTEQQEMDFLRRAADIFRNQLCRSKVYCRTAADRQGELHDLLDKLMTKSQKLSDSSVCLYYFRHVPKDSCTHRIPLDFFLFYLRNSNKKGKSGFNEPMFSFSIYVCACCVQYKFMGCVDVDRVSAVFRDALSSFLSRRKSPLSAQMFTDLFTRFPVLCVNLLDTAVQNITSGIREHQQVHGCCFLSMKVLHKVNVNAGFFLFCCIEKRTRREKKRKIFCFGVLWCRFCGVDHL
uniref:Myb-binding protein 1A-like protein n=1 Tax=Gouania willdenowi TaxID=441366 RepID=A0A8C5ERP3_GOUWI